MHYYPVFFRNLFSTIFVCSETKKRYIKRENEKVLIVAESISLNQSMCKIVFTIAFRVFVCLPFFLDMFDHL